MITVKYRTTEFDRKGVKYIAIFTNLDKKFGFKRDFINGFSMTNRSNNMLIEVALTTGDKKYYHIDDKNQTYKEVSYDDIKKEKAKNNEEFCMKYFR